MKRSRKPTVEYLESKALLATMTIAAGSIHNLSSAGANRTFVVNLAKTQPTTTSATANHGISTALNGGISGLRVIQNGRNIGATYSGVGSGTSFTSLRGLTSLPTSTTQRTTTWTAQLTTQPTTNAAKDTTTTPPSGPTYTIKIG